MNGLEKYVTDKIDEFLKDNKITEKQWQKHGIIQKIPQNTPDIKYILYYKTIRKKAQKEIIIDSELYKYFFL